MVDSWLISKLLSDVVQYEVRQRRHNVAEDQVRWTISN